ncbi:shikimate kinase [Spirochaetia bacterium]|nr:shikimate kinase [Spirochaetia bacterium]
MGLIILTGPKHSGKTSAGRALAEQCAATHPTGAAIHTPGAGTFTDLDELVEKRTGKSPRTLFKEVPGVFRAAEAEALQSLLNAEVQTGPAGGNFCIVAAGGGLIDNGAALDLLKRFDAAVLVYLDVSAETAWERIKSAAKKTGELPPFLNTADPQETHRLLHERRAAAYREIAHIIIKADGKSPEDLGREILLSFRSL